MPQLTHVSSIFCVFIVIFYTNFKGYTPITGIKEYWLYSLCCIIHPCSLSYTQQFVPLNPPSLYYTSPHLSLPGKH